MTSVKMTTFGVIASSLRKLADVSEVLSAPLGRLVFPHLISTRLADLMLQ